MPSAVQAQCTVVISGVGMANSKKSRVFVTRKLDVVLLAVCFTILQTLDARSTVSGIVLVVKGGVVSNPQCSIECQAGMSAFFYQADIFLGYKMILYQLRYNF